MAATKTLNFDIFGRDRSASKALGGVGAAVGRLGGQFSQLAGLIGVAFATREVVQFGKDSVAAFVDAQKSQALLADAYERFPALADTNIEALRKLNSALALKTGFDDDATASGQAVLAQFGLTGAQIKKLTPLLQDYARKTEQDLPTAAESLGKALLGNGRALKNVGIDFKNAGSVAANYDQIVAGLTEKVGGYAEKFGTTAAGKFEILTTKWGEFQEKVGEALLPGLAALADFASSDILPGLQTAAEWFATDGMSGIKMTVEWLGKYKDMLGPAAALVVGLTVAQWGLNIAMDSNPIGLIILGVEAGIALMVTAIGVWSFIFDHVTLQWGYFEAAGINAISSIIGGLNFLLKPFNDIINAINFITGSNFANVSIPTFSATYDKSDSYSSNTGGRTGGKTIINVTTSDPMAAASAVGQRLSGAVQTFG